MVRDAVESLNDEDFIVAYPDLVARMEAIFVQLAELPGGPVEPTAILAKRTLTPGTALLPLYIQVPRRLDPRDLMVDIHPTFVLPGGRYDFGLQLSSQAPAPLLQPSFAEDEPSALAVQLEAVAGHVTVAVSVSPPPASTPTTPLSASMPLTASVAVAQLAPHNGPHIVISVEVRGDQGGV